MGTVSIRTILLLVKNSKIGNSMVVMVKLKLWPYSEKNFMCIRRGGTIKCIINSNQQYGQVDTGYLEIPCLLIFGARFRMYMLSTLLPVLLFIKLMVVSRKVQGEIKIFTCSYCLWLSLWCLSNCCKNEEIGVSNTAVSKPMCYIHTYDDLYTKALAKLPY